MKKALKKIGLVIGILAMLGMVYNLWAYTQLKELLIPENPILPPIVDTYTIGIGLSFIFTAGFHLLLLFHTIYFLPKMKKDLFWGSCFFCGVVLSGLFIGSDVALLNDLGNEYLLWDITMEWQILTTTCTLQLTLMVTGFVVLLRSKETTPFAWFPKAEKFDESMFRIVTIIGMISATLVLLLLPLPSIMGVADDYRNSYLITLAILALLPFASSVIYWMIRNRGKQFAEVLDEKQFQDISFGGLVAVVALILLLISGIFLSMANHIDLNNPLYSLITIAILVITINGTVLLRSRN